jgi:FlaA1/EpsC-like NDP-sugar epimerase
MNSEKGENSPDSSNGRVLKIRVAASTALKELHQMRSARHVGQEALDVEVERIARKKLQPRGYDLVVQRRRDDLARLLTKIRRGEAGYDLAKKFLHENKGLPPETEVWLVTLDLRGKKVIVIGGKESIGRAIAEAVAREGADVVIWLRQWNDEANEAKVMPIVQVEVASQRQANGAAPISLWRQTAAHKSYWWSGWVMPEPYIWRSKDFGNKIAPRR